RSICGMPCALRTFNANRDLLQLFIFSAMWVVILRLFCIVTPSITRESTLAMLGNGAGISVRFFILDEDEVTIISYDLVSFSLRLLSEAHSAICCSSNAQV